MYILVSDYLSHLLLHKEVHGISALPVSLFEIKKKTHCRPKGPQQFSGQVTVQDGVIRVNQGITSEGMVDIQSHPEECLLSHPHPSFLLKVSQSFLWGQDLPVQGPSVWFCFSPLAPHAGGKESDVPPRECTSPPVPGWLVRQSPVPTLSQLPRLGLPLCPWAGWIVNLHKSAKN